MEVVSLVFFLVSPAINFVLAHVIVDWNISKISEFLLIFSVLIYLRKLRLQKNVFLYFGAAWLLYLFINAITGQSVVNDIKFFIRFSICVASGVMIFLFLYQDKVSFEGLNKILSGLILFVLLFVLLDLFLFEHLNYLQKLLPNFKTFYFRNLRRASGLFISPNELGFYINCLWLFKFYIFNKTKAIVVTKEVMLWGFSALMIFVTYSLASLVSLVFVSSCFFLYKYSNELKIIPFIKSALISVLTLFVIVFGYSQRSNIEEVRNYFTSNDSIKNYTWISSSPSKETRFLIIKTALTYFSESPLKGIGIFAFTDVFKQEDEGRNYHTHNLILEVLVGQGVIGILFLTGGLFLIYRKTENDRFLFISFLNFIFLNFFDNFMWSYAFYHFLSLLFAFLLLNSSAKILTLR